MSSITSMTGFGRAEKTSAIGTLAIEIKTVNHRFLDSRLHFPRDLAWLEIPLMRTIKGRVARGKFEIAIRWTPTEAYAPRARFNLPLLETYQRELAEIARALGRPGSASFEYLLALPGVAEKECVEIDPSQLLELAQGTLAEALDNLIVERAREGEILRQELLGRLEELARMRDQIEERRDAVVEAYRIRLRKKAKEWAKAAAVDLDTNRLETEVLLFAERSDVTEELLRLHAHIEAFGQALGNEQDQSQGKRLEFLTQELLRETNTIASKARDTDVASLTLEMKNEIEKIREQTLNVE